MNITKNKKEKCVMARIMRESEKYQKNFTLNEYKTWGKAEAAAQKWVTNKSLKLPKKLTTKGIKTSRNTSGIVGVRLACSVKYKHGNSYESWRWLAYWPGCPFRGGISWTIPKYGDNESFVMAAIARKMESVNRDEIRKKMERIKNKKEYKEILALKQLELH